MSEICGRRERTQAPPVSKRCAQALNFDKCKAPQVNAGPSALSDEGFFALDELDTPTYLPQVMDVNPVRGNGMGGHLQQRDISPPQTHATRKGVWRPIKASRGM